jgi:hypothetical protein
MAARPCRHCALTPRPRQGGQHSSSNLLQVRCRRPAGRNSHARGCRGSRSRCRHPSCRRRPLLWPRKVSLAPTKVVHAYPVHRQRGLSHLMGSPIDETQIPHQKTDGWLTIFLALKGPLCWIWRAEDGRVCKGCSKRNPTDLHARV